jgi:type IV secretory pathway VirB10-like protein
MLPYGGSHKSGGGSLPPETILMGQFSYGGQGERVFIVFNRAVLPDGQEIAISAQALSSKDYRPGVIGDYHSNKGVRLASVIGLSMASGISEVMVEKQGLGQSFNVVPKANLKNGLYNGVAKVTEMEANDQATQLAQTPNYVTIDSGTDIIISLGESFGTNE